MAARALPPERMQRLGDWWLRRSRSSSWWLGTVLPHGNASGTELAELIAASEAFYAGSGSAAAFQVSPGACPAGLDAALAGRGYRWHGPMSLQTASVWDVSTRTGLPGGDVRLGARPSTAWFDAWYAVHGHGSDRDTEWAVLDRVSLPTAYVSVLHGSEVVAVGRGVAEQGWVGVFGMATLPAARGRRAARQVLAALASWAAASGATGLYLQVECANHPAVQLYARHGFSERCRYHYRHTQP